MRRTPADTLRRTRAGAGAMLLGAAGALWLLAFPGDPGAPGRASPDTVEVERVALLMGTRLTVAVRAPDRETGFAAAGAALEAVRRVEAALSTWRADSELSRVNGAPVGKPVRVRPALAALLAQLDRWRRRTDGAFDPAVGSLVGAWGLRTGGRRPAPAELRRARDAAGMRHFDVDPEAGTVVRREPEAWIDAGAFGKGLALDSAASALRARGIAAARLDFGGQLLVYGYGPSTCRPVGVAHPRRRDRVAVTVELCDGSLATSGTAERFVVVDGERLGHVIDPRTGAPTPAWGSVTVAHRDPMVADLLSTALYVMGPDRGSRWARAHDVDALFLRVGGNAAAAGPEALEVTATGRTPRLLAGPRRSASERR